MEEKKLLLLEILDMCDTEYASEVRGNKLLTGILSDTLGNKILKVKVSTITRNSITIDFIKVGELYRGRGYLSMLVDVLISKYDNIIISDVISKEVYNCCNNRGFVLVSKDMPKDICTNSIYFHKYYGDLVHTSL